jgi:hypothetical protein
MTNPARTLMDVFSVSHGDIALAARAQNLRLSRSTVFRLTKGLIPGSASQKQAVAAGLAHCIQSRLEHFDSGFLFPAHNPPGVVPESTPLVVEPPKPAT